jgi:hypothetical protein
MSVFTLLFEPLLCGSLLATVPLLRKLARKLHSWENKATFKIHRQGDPWLMWREL